MEGDGKLRGMKSLAVLALALQKSAMVRADDTLNVAVDGAFGKPTHWPY